MRSICLVLLLAFGSSAWATTPCVGGMAGSYPCEDVDLLSHLSFQTNTNDLWGWVDPLNGDEYAIVGLVNGTAFVNVTDPENPVVVAQLFSYTGSSTWRDIKVYQNHAFIVSEASGHGLQIYDLTQLRNIAVPPQFVSETAHYSGFGRAHNIVINEVSGYAYVVGSDQDLGGLHMLNIQNPTSPIYVGSFAQDGYTRDAQCVNYAGPDFDYVGGEICIACNIDTITIVDVTSKASPTDASQTGYAGYGYISQGWLTEDHRYFLQSDELDESNNGHPTRTHIWDLVDLDAPSYLGFFENATAAIDHNQYVNGNHLYQANYTAGLRIFDLADVANGNLSEAAFFDIHPSSDAASIDGAWSVYPYLPSGNILVSGIEEGLFVLRWPSDLTSAPPAARGAFVLEQPWPNPFNPQTSLHFTLGRGGHVRLTIHDVSGRRVATLLDEWREIGDHEVSWSGRGGDGGPVASGAYFVRMEAFGESQTQKLVLLK